MAPDQPTNQMGLSDEIHCNRMFCGESKSWTIRTQRCQWTQQDCQWTGNSRLLIMPEDQEQEQTQQLLQLQQQNINKSLLSQLDLLQSLKCNMYDVCTIQELYIDFQGHTWANCNWTTIYPNTHKTHPDSTRSIILINTNLLTDAWKQIDFNHPDIMAVEITGQFSTLQVINVYNDGNNNNALTYISAFMRDWERQQYTMGLLHTIWMGDFNCNHPLWDEPWNAHLFTTENLELTQPLLNMLGWHNIKMAMPLFILMLWSHSTGNHTRIDNIFCMERLMDAIIKCNTEDSARPIKTDHYLIVTQIDIHTPTTAWKPRHNFRLTDWTELVKTLKDDLASIPPPTEIASIQEFNNKLNVLN